MRAVGITVNKAAAAETAAIVLQDGYSGRAEIGLAGDDDLRLKVSEDGAAWRDALRVDRRTGRVAAPSGWEGRNLNLAVNGDFSVNQRGFAGGASAAGAYGFDRWRAAPGVTMMAKSGPIVTLQAGGVVPSLDAELWGEASFAGMPLVVSVDEMSGGSLAVSVGAATAVLAPGPGRRSLALQAPADAGARLDLRLQTQGAPVSFARLKVESGTAATDWEPRPTPVEMQLCRRYFLRLGGESAYQFFGLGYAASSTLAYIPAHPLLMRAAPALSVSAPGDFAIASGANFTQCASIFAATTGASAFLLGAQVAGGLGVGLAAGLQAFNTFAATISLDAEL